jgi:hypothetical protein
MMNFVKVGLAIKMEIYLKVTRMVIFDGREVLHKTYTKLTTNYKTIVA